MCANPNTFYLHIQYSFILHIAICDIGSLFLIFNGTVQIISFQNYSSEIIALSLYPIFSLYLT